MGALGGIRSLVELPWYARLREVYKEIRARTLTFLFRWVVQTCSLFLL
jgi:hypothetical protein